MSDLHPITARARSRPTVLVVDDDVLVLRTLGRMLGESDWHLLLASSPRAALELSEVRKRAIDVLITDFRMPGMNGYDLGLALLRRYPAMRVVLVTGSAAECSRQVREHGRMMEVLLKPFSTAVLRAALGRALDAATAGGGVGGGVG